MYFLHMDMIIDTNAHTHRSHRHTSNAYRLASAYLRLGESEAGREFGALGQRQVLGALKPPIELLELQGTVDGAGLAHFLALAVHPQTGVLALVGEGTCGRRRKCEHQPLSTLNGTVKHTRESRTRRMSVAVAITGNWLAGQHVRKCASS